MDELLDTTSVDDLPTLTKTLNAFPKLVYNRDKDGHTLLHFACDRGMAEVLLGFVKKDKQEEFLWRQATNGRTAFDLAVAEQKFDVVEYLFNYAAENNWTRGKVYPSDCPLHYARSEHMARFLVDNVPKNERVEFLRIRDADERTALHKATERGFKSVIQYLCELDDGLQLCVDSYCNTALHLACSESAALLLCDKVPQDSQNINGETVLHTAVVRGLEAVVVKLCKFNAELGTVKDNNGDIPLSRAGTAVIAKCLIECVPVESRKVCVQAEYRKLRNRGNNNTALLCLREWLWAHYVVTSDKDSLEELKQPTSLDGSGAEMVFIEGFKSMLECGNADKDTFTLYCVSQRKWELLSDILGYVKSYFESDLHRVFLQTNTWKQNVFHLSCMSAFADDFLSDECLGAYLNQLRTADVFTLDHWENTPLAYLNGEFRFFCGSELLFRVPFPARRNYDLKKKKWPVKILDINTPGSSPGKQSTDPFHNVPAKSIKHHRNMCIVLNYASNVYFRTDLMHIEQILEYKSSPTGEGLDWFYFVADREKMSPSKIQELLYKVTDSLDNHGKPKVFVVQFSTDLEVTYISPPGPDVIILTIILHGDSLDLDTSRSFPDVRDLIEYLRTHKDVSSVNINSTQGRHFVRPAGDVPEDATVLATGPKGRAHIVYTTRDRKYYEQELKFSEELCKKLGLEGEPVEGGSAADILKGMKNFAGSQGHGQIAVTIVMAHGDGLGDIRGNDEKSTFSVQDVLDALKNLKTFQMVILTFCRGEIMQCGCNRTYKSLECSVLKDAIEVVHFGRFSHFLSGIPAQCVSEKKMNSKRDDKKEKRKSDLPFPSVKVPENCLLIYPTLPDTKITRYAEYDPANTFTESFAEYLKPRHEEPRRSDTLQGAMSSPIKEQLHDLMTDVAGFVRENSAFTQYANFSYTVNKNTKPIYLEIPSATAS